MEQGPTGKRAYLSDNGTGDGASRGAIKWTDNWRTKEQSLDPV